MMKSLLKSLIIAFVLFIQVKAQTPTVTISCPSMTCVGNSFVASATFTNGTPSFQRWYTIPANSANITDTTAATSDVLFTVPGTYSLVMTASIGGNFFYDTVSVSIAAVPTVTITSSNLNLCLGDSLTLTPSVSGGVAPYSYYWQTGNGIYSASSQIQHFKPTNFGSIFYTLTVSDANSCSTNSSIVDTIVALPSVNASGETVCSNSLLHLYATSDNSGTDAFQWTGPNAFNSNAQYPVFPNAAPNLTGNYTISVTNIYGCKSTNTVYAQVNLVPTAIVNATGKLSCNSSLVTLNSSSNIGIPIVEWYLPNYMNSYSVTVNNPGMVKLVIKDNLGC